MNLIKAQIRNKLRQVLGPLMETDEAMEFVIDDVLSLLDGLGECVAEGDIWEPGQGCILYIREERALRPAQSVVEDHFNPGDRIAIYKMPKDRR